MFFNAPILNASEFFVVFTFKKMLIVNQFYEVIHNIDTDLMVAEGDPKQTNQKL